MIDIILFLFPILFHYSLLFLDGSWVWKKVYRTGCLARCCVNVLAICFNVKSIWRSMRCFLHFLLLLFSYNDIFGWLAWQWLEVFSKHSAVNNLRRVRRWLDIGRPNRILYFRWNIIVEEECEKQKRCKNFIILVSKFIHSIQFHWNCSSAKDGTRYGKANEEKTLNSFRHSTETLYFMYIRWRIKMWMEPLEKCRDRLHPSIISRRPVRRMRRHKEKKLKTQVKFIFM